MKTWHVPMGWSSPATWYPIETRGRSRIVRHRYRKGLYDMYGIRGYRFYELGQRLDVTALQLHTGRGWKTWMVDDPVHWEGIQEYAGWVRPGRCLIAGMGLGLILHALAGRDDVDRTVVERSADVIELVAPLVPLPTTTRVVQADFWEFVTQVDPGKYSTVFVDLWVGSGPKLWPEVDRARRALAALFPDAKRLFFGFQPRVDMIDAAERLVQLASSR